MSRRIEADPDLLDSVARQLNAISGNIRTQGRTMDQVSTRTEAAWSSQYTPDFTDSVAVVKGNLNKSAAAVSELAARLHEIAEEIRELERELSRR